MLPLVVILQLLLPVNIFVKGLYLTCITCNWEHSNGKDHDIIIYIVNIVNCFTVLSLGEVEAELLHTYSRIDPYDTLILCVRVAVLTAVTLTVPIVLFPVSFPPLASLSEQPVDETQCHGSLKLCSGEKSDPADDVPQQDLLLAPTHRHCLHPAHFYQPACHFRSKHPWNLWSHW